MMENIQRFRNKTQDNSNLNMALEALVILTAFTHSREGVGEVTTVVP